MEIIKPERKSETQSFFIIVLSGQLCPLPDLGIKIHSDEASTGHFFRVLKIHINIFFSQLNWD